MSFLFSSFEVLRLDAKKILIKANLLNMNSQSINKLNITTADKKYSKIREPHKKII